MNIKNVCKAGMLVVTLLGSTNLAAMEQNKGIDTKCFDVPCNFCGASAISTDGRFFACSAPGSVEVWNPLSQEHACILSYRRNIETLVITPDGKFLAVIERQLFV